MFANTVAHELHQVGFASLGARVDSGFEGLAPRPLMVAHMIRAIGEGLAMPAAAGGPTVHPHAAGLAADRERWDADVARADADIARVEAFLLDVLAGRIASPDSVRAGALAFYGIQGRGRPWVGSWRHGWRHCSGARNSWPACWTHGDSCVATMESRALKVGRCGPSSCFAHLEPTNVRDPRPATVTR